MSNSKAAMTKLALDLAINKPKTMDIPRYLSQGKGGGKTFIDEERSKRKLNFSVSNTTANDLVVVMGSSQNSMFENDAAILTEFGADAMLTTGDIIFVDADHKLTVTSNDSNRDLDQWIRHVANNPTRMVRVAMSSSIAATGAPETSNFTTDFQTSWVQPYHKSEDEYLSLREYQGQEANSPQFATVNFLKTKIRAVLSPEHFFMFTVKAGTTISHSWTIGIEDSRNQRFWRAVKNADTELATYRIN